MESIWVDLENPMRKFYGISTFKDLSDFIRFTVFRVRNESFIATIEGREFHITVMPEISGRGWVAIEDGMYGGEPGSIYHNHSMESREDALQGLIEKIKDSI
jgi:hypothetical protein